MGKASPHVQVVPGHRQRTNATFLQALVGQRLPCPGRGIVAGDAAKVRKRPVAGLGQASPHVQVVPGHRQRTNNTVQAPVRQCVPCPGSGIVAGDIAQVRQRPVAGSGEPSPHVQVVARHRQLINPVVQTLVGQRMPCPGSGIVAGDTAQVRQRPVAGLFEPPPHVQVAPEHCQRKNPTVFQFTVQALVGQRVPCPGSGIEAGDVAQFRQRPVDGLGELPPYVQVAPGHRQRKNITDITIQALVGQRVPCPGSGIVAGDIAQVRQRPVAGSGEPSPHVQVV
ncbi:MAG: hypothetical protein WBF05_08585, partial [Anaerolineales bacterium]